MNHLTGDHPYVVCEVKHADNRAEKSRAETKPVTEGDTLNPVWNEKLELEHWEVGEAIEFTVFDKGLLGSKTEGRITMPSEIFYPHGFNGRIGLPGVPNCKLHISLQIERIEVNQPAVEESQVVNTEITEDVPKELEVPGDSPQKLAVSILEAHDLQQMNHFTGDHPYVVCEVVGKGLKVETKPVTEGQTMSPFWGETHTLDPYCPGDSLEFTVYDKGLLGAKTEGRVLLPPELIYPHGFSGMLRISGLPHALLHIIVRPLGPSAKEEAQTNKGKKSKKDKRLKIQKKSKGCC